MVKNIPARQETWVRSLGREDPVEKEWQPTSEFLPGDFHGQRNLEGKMLIPRIKLYGIVNTRWRYNRNYTHQFLLIPQRSDSSHSVFLFFF